VRLALAERRITRRGRGHLVVSPDYAMPWKSERMVGSRDSRLWPMAASDLSSGSRPGPEPGACQNPSGYQWLPHVAEDVMVWGVVSPSDGLYDFRLPAGALGGVKIDNDVLNVKRVDAPMTADCSSKIPVNQQVLQYLQPGETAFQFA